MSIPTRYDRVVVVEIRVTKRFLGLVALRQGEPNERQDELSLQRYRHS
jgi:hypothetical protein